MHSQDKMISFVLLWTGKWPRWIDLFLVSCGANPNVTWQLFCPEAPPRTIPPNVLIHRMSLDEIKSLIEQKTGYNASTISGYKFCDLKPAYGKVFEDYLSNFKFFGFCDCDQIWGSFERNLNPEWFDQYDIITAQRMTICGQMTLMRKTDLNRQLFRCIRNYERCLLDSKTHGLDELPMDDAEE